MKNNWSAIISIIGIIIILCVAGLQSCSSQNIAKNWGGEMELNLEPNQKLVNITWKESDLWILTKDMTTEDVAESYQFIESSNIGLFEGKIYIKETKLSDEEYSDYSLQNKLKEDYLSSSNTSYNGKEIFIHYDEDTDTYSIIKEYEIINGELVEK